MKSEITKQSVTETAPKERAPSMMPALTLAEANLAFKRFATSNRSKQINKALNHWASEASNLDTLILIAERLTDTKTAFTERDFLSIWRTQGLDERISMDECKEFFARWTSALEIMRKLETVQGIDETIFLQLN